MVSSLKLKSLYALKLAIAFAPWLISIYVLYWLGKNEIWTPETAHRDKITIAVVALGMVSTFLLLSRFAKRSKE